jgi:serine/threonine-protein kinase
MSPEQAQDSGAADIRSDIYSLGCTYYHMLSGKCPFPIGSLVERILKHREADPADIRTLNPTVSAPAVEVLQKMMTKKPEERFQTPRELLQELEDTGRFGGSATPPLFPSLASREAKRRSQRPEASPEPVEVPPTEEHARRDKTAEFPRADKALGRPIGGKKKRFRDQSAEKSKDKRRRTRLPAWWPWAAGGTAVFVVVLILWPFLGDTQRQPMDDGQPNPPKAVSKITTRERDKERPPGKKPGPVIMGPEEPPLPRLFQPALPLELDALRQEFLGPFRKVLAPPPEAKLVKVRRLPGPGEYRSVAEAIANTAGPLLVEIHDQGPIFEPSVPAVRERSLWIRGGAGYRPLVAWDVAAAKDKTPYLALAGGSLTLEDIDVVAKWPAGGVSDPECLFAIRGSHFQAINSTFTVAGKYPRGLVLVQMQRSALNTTAAAALETASVDPSLDQAPARVHFKHCYVRGSDLVVLGAKGTPLDALIEGSLLVGGDRAMIQIAGTDEDKVTLRLVRSTLVCGQNCVRWQNLGSKPGSPQVQVLAWDALIARAHADTAQGDMLALEDGDLTHVKWRPVNCLYAGWKRLLFSMDKSVGTGSIGTWQAIWSIREGDQELAEAWPGHLPEEPEGLDPQAFTPYETAALFAASGGSGPLGCELGRLPPETHLALQRTFDRYPIPVMPLPETDGPPPIPASADGLYEGERLDVAKIDLGKHLQARLRAARPGPRVVLHLAGTGKQYTSPIKIKGIPNLVVYFEPVPDREEPLTLLPKPQAVEELGALIEVEDGNLELIKARFLLENKRAGVVPAQLVRMRGGDLILNGCYLQGALDKAPEGYQGLIRFEGTGDRSGALPGVLVKDTVLMSSRSLIDLRGSARVRLRNCAALAVDDGFVFTRRSLATPSVFVQLENNTLAVRKALISAAGAEGDRSGTSEAIVIQARQNYFLNPFADEPHQAQLVLVSRSGVALGILQWQGTGNAFDRSRLGYFGSGKDEPGKQSFKEWQQLWGSPGEQDALLLEPAKSSKTFTLDPPSWQHLGLPAQVRVGAGPPLFGADLVRLGIIKRKAGG